MLGVCGLLAGFLSLGVVGGASSCGFAPKGAAADADAWLIVWQMSGERRTSSLGRTSYKRCGAKEDRDAIPERGKQQRCIVEDVEYPVNY